MFQVYTPAHELGLNVIAEAPDNTEKKSIPTEDILKMLEFVIKINQFEFNGKVEQQLLGSAIGTKCAPPCAFIFMDKQRQVSLKVKNTKG